MPSRTSVVIPVRDDERHLRRCLAALERQSHPADEIVVVDNGSTDGSARVARAAGARVVAEPVIGIPAAASTGYDAARFDLILRLDADSVPPPTWIARIHAEFDGDPTLDALTGPGGMAHLPRVRRRLAQALYMDAYFRLVGAALGHPPLFGSNMAMRAAAWADVRGDVHRADPEIHDDMDLSIHLGARHRIRLDRRLSVQISSRPLRNASGMVRRVRRGFHTLRAHRQWGPVARWRSRVRRRVIGGRAGLPASVGVGRD